MLRWFKQWRCKHVGKDFDRPYPTVKFMREGGLHPMHCAKCGKYLGLRDEGGRSE